MRFEQHGWYSGRVGKYMKINVYGHYGLPLLAFPTSQGDERELEGQSLIQAMQWWIDQGRVKVFCVDTVNNESWYNKQAHPRHRSWLQAQFDEYLAREVVPFIHWSCQSPGITITTTGASFGAYHAVNTLLKHPDLVRRCIAMSGVYDVKSQMDGDYDDNFYFNNPMDYMAGMNDSWYYAQYHRCELRLTTGHGPWEDSGPTYRFSELLSSKGVPHWVDNWGPDGGHDWPYWKKQMQTYLNGMF
jgi:esterase/lipase superfamily enzyme